jgi:hypothetical protein
MRSFSNGTNCRICQTKKVNDYNHKKKDVYIQAPVAPKTPIKATLGKRICFIQVFEFWNQRDKHT